MNINIARRSPPSTEQAATRLAIALDDIPIRYDVLVESCELYTNTTENDTFDVWIRGRKFAVTLTPQDED